MNLYPVSELRLLAAAYCASQDITPAVLGQRMGLNDKIFPRLLNGKGCTAASAEFASQWFADNWPSDLPWPINGVVEAAE